jgi:hypothetical protein
MKALREPTAPPMPLNLTTAAYGAYTAYPQQRHRPDHLAPKSLLPSQFQCCHRYRWAPWVRHHKAAAQMTA